MDIVTVTMKAAQDITAGQVVRITGSPATPAVPPAFTPAVTPAVQQSNNPDDETLHTLPLFGIALRKALAKKDVDVQIGGVVFRIDGVASGGLGTGKPCAVGVNSSGHLVRANARDKDDACINACISAPNWIGDCDASGNGDNPAPPRHAAERARLRSGRRWKGRRHGRAPRCPGLRNENRKDDE